ncbi:MAG TPA: hypothetical protein VHD87_08215 [Acidimicrobiales bacterium]|nr:hypothetical protein [Acidimicrobiales bacterium]
MSRISIDPAELAALSALCRNASYDAAGVATEVDARVRHLTALLHADGAAADAARIEAAVHTAVHQLHHVANELDSDALAVATFGQRGAAADALGDLHGNDHALLARLHNPGEDKA